MSLKEFMALILLVEIMIVIGMLVWAIPNIIDGIIRVRRRNKFGKELSRLFDINSLDRNQIEILSKEYYLNSKDVQLATRRQFKESVSINEIAPEKIKYFQELFQEYEQDEPFEGLPSDVRLHLERVRETIGKQHDHMLQPLASQLQELSDESFRKQKKMWWISVASLMIGVASLAFGAYTHFSPVELDNNQLGISTKHNKQINKD